MTFAAQINSFEQKYEKRCTTLLKKVSLDLFRKVVLKTPVDTGRARGNWMVGINSIPTKTQLKIDKKPMSRIVHDVSYAKFGDNVALTNSVNYIGKLEYGGYPKSPKYGSWHKGDKGVRRGGKKKGRLGYYEIKSVEGFSYQAPHGMVRVSIAEYIPTLNKAVSLVKQDIP